MADQPMLHDEEDGHDMPSPPAQSNKRALKICLAASFGVAVLVATIVGILYATRTEKSLGAFVETDNIMSRFDDLFEIAQHGGLNSRSVLKNYNLSVEYVIAELNDAGTCVHIDRPHFMVPIHTELSKPSLSQLSPNQFKYQHSVDFAGMRYGGDGIHTDVVGTVFVVSNSGCEDADYDGMPEDAIVLVANDGVCAIVDKALLAESKNAIAVLQSNAETSTTLSTTRVRFVDWKEGDALVTIPVFAVSYSLGEALRATEDVQLQFSASLLLETTMTSNIICETGDSLESENVIMVGAHLDSVPEGPGMNDNGSGSMTVLELAVQYGRHSFAKKAKNPVRFAWWGAEEIGLLGARDWVRRAQESGELSRVALYFNYDMLGSPNFTPQVHDANLVPEDVDEETITRSAKLQAALESWFQEQELPFDHASMTGGSDYLPFIEAGIPGGGMATGASGKKTDDERLTFGGLAEAAFDPCYHLYCDTVLNISRDAIEQCSQAAAHALAIFTGKESLRAFLSE